MNLKDFWRLHTGGNNFQGEAKQNSSKDQTAPLNESIVHYILLHT